MTSRPQNKPHSREDERWMAVALSLARRGLGTTWPNPSVGCVLVKGNTVVGRGWTQPGGRPHAETEALDRAGSAARGATAYVTLEPCNHHGRTPPCSEALIAAGVSRVVAACEDPDPRVGGQGLAHLRDEIGDVSVGCLEGMARGVNAGFLSRESRGRPFVTLKLATSLDGRIATAAGESKWITGALSRRLVHRLRAAHDAILTGMGTVRADNPELTARLPGLPIRPPVRAVLSSDGKFSAALKMSETAETVPVWVLTPNADASVAEGVRLLPVAARTGRPDIVAALEVLAGEGVTRVLIEAGAEIAASALRAGVVDQLYWFRAPVTIGGDGQPVTSALGIGSLAEVPGFERVDIRPVGDDVLEVYVCQSGHGPTADPEEGG